MTAATNRELETVARTARRSPGALVVLALGPLVVLGGVVWAAFQPYRLTLLQPRAADFWSLVVEPPLLVILAGLLFHLVVARSVVADLEYEAPPADEARGRRGRRADATTC